MLVVSSWSSIQLRTGTDVPPSTTFAPHAASVLDVVLKIDFPVRTQKARPIENATADAERTARVAYRRYTFLVRMAGEAGINRGSFSSPVLLIIVCHRRVPESNNHRCHVPRPKYIT